jgi:hypothetical protein
MPNNQQSQWINGQVVNATQMTALTQDLYNKLTFITQNYKPCILYLAGDITQVDNNITIPDGAFRFEDSDNSATLQYNTGIFGNAQGTTLAVTGDGYIVARYVLNPIIPNQYNYTFATSYVFVATPIADTDVVICVITAGIISQKSGIFPYQDITNNSTDGNVNIGGRVANSANNIRTLGVGGTGYAGLSTANASTQLYATEADGTTINTGIVNQYGYRPYHTGTATAILDPAKTYAYVSELPVVTNSIKVKAIPVVGPGSSYQQLQAIYDGSTWGCTISGGLALTGSGATFSAVIDLTLLGISGATVEQAGVVNVDSISGSFTTTPFPYELRIFTLNSTSLKIYVQYSVGTTNIVVVNVAYAITFTATSVS